MSTSSNHTSVQPGSRPLYPMQVAHKFVPGGCVLTPECPPYSLAHVNPAALQQAHEADTKLWDYNERNSDTNLRVLPSLSILAESAFSRLTGCNANQAKDWADAMVTQYSRHHSKLAVDSDDASPKRTKSMTTVALLQADASSASARRPRGPCGYVFMRGDIAWNCRTCQTDPTCVICDTCFRNSNHEGHEVYFHRTTPGGCCDCGDIEAWAREGCCDRHRPEPVDNAVGEASQNDPMEAVTMSAKGYQQGREAIAQSGMDPMVLAALGVVIGAAVNAIVESFDGAALGADPMQWRLKWAEEAARIMNGQAFADGGFDANRSLVTPKHFLLESDNGNVLPLPEGYHLQLRLHNDDVHTYDEVIEALFEPRPGRRTIDGTNVMDTSLVPVRDRAREMTQHVDSDGQVIVKTYSTIPAAMQGFRRLKSRGLHCAVISASQVHLEMRAKNLTVWLQEIAAAHPAAAVLVVHALVQVDPYHDMAGVHVWREAHMMPLWAGMERSDSEDQVVAKRFEAFPPHLLSSYVTREESELLHGIAMSTHPEAFLRLTSSSSNFYSNVGWRFPSARYKKSPHALWGTLPSLYIDSSPLESRHPLLQRLSTGMMDAGVENVLTEAVYVVDTDFRKQAEADQLTTSVFPHKLPGLHMISGIGTVRVDEISERRPPLPSPMAYRNELANVSFRAPLSPLLLLLLTDPYPTKAARATLHSLFLSLLTDSRFRCRFAGAIGVAYRPLSTLFCAGVGTEADTPLHFTVQIFTAGSLVRALGYLPAAVMLLTSDKSISTQAISDRNIPSGESNPAALGVFLSPIAYTIVRCVHTNLLGATKEVSMILKNTSRGNDEESQEGGHQLRNDSLFPSLTYQAGEHPLKSILPAAPDDGFLDSRLSRHKRLPHLLRDLEYVIETHGTALRLLLPIKFPHCTSQEDGREEFLTFASVYSRMLRLAQGIDPQKRKISGGHVEYEQSRWLEAFGLSLNLAGTRDALAESAMISSAAVMLADVSYHENAHLPIIREAGASLIAALIREIKHWLYQEGVLESGFPVSPSHGSQDIAQAEALQRSTLHVSSCQFASEAEESTPSTVALACASGIKMTENQLALIENALRADAAEREHQLLLSRSHEQRFASIPPPMCDWLRVPHSPLGGDSLSFHLPLHRALAKCVKSILAVVIPEAVKTVDEYWWKIPVLDLDALNSTSSQHHSLLPLIAKTLHYQNCRVTWSLGPECSAQEAQRRKARSRTVSANIAVTKVLHSLADHPIRCIAAAQQIERHLWARNGSSVAGMAMNYTSTPLCRSFRDLDLLLVQLSAAGMSCGLGARRVFTLLLSRFNMEGYLCDPERRLQIAQPSGIYSQGYGIWVAPPRLADPDHAIVLSESFFATLCILVSELPPPPPAAQDDDSPIKQTVRRELLHALAAEPRSHSEALAAASAGFSRREENEGSASRFRDVFAEVLREIAKQKTPGSSRAASGPPSYELKPDVCDEYDPTFYHLRRSEHQHAMDVVARLRKQTLSNDKDAADAMCRPLVCPPPKAHPRLLPCRLLLHLSSLDAAVRRALLFALTGGSWLPPPEPISSDDTMTDAGPSSVAVSTTSGSQGGDEVPVTQISRRFMQSPPTNAGGRRSQADAIPFSKEVVNASSVSFLEVLQLLTLQIHTLEECASLHRLLPTLDEESRLLSSGISINSFLNRLIKVPASLDDVWALKPFPDGPLTSNGSGERRGSILGLLIALYEHRADHAALLDSDNREFTTSDADDHGGARSLSTSGLKWLLRFVHSLVDGANNVSAAVKCATTGVPVTALPTSSIARPFVANDLGGSTWTIDEQVRTTISRMLTGLIDLWPKKDEEKTAAPDTAASKSKEARKAAQQRILEKMKLQQAAFAATIAPSSNIAGVEASETEAELCIICRCDDTDGENNGPLGYLGHVQRSRLCELRAITEATIDNSKRQALHHSYRVVGHMGCQLRETESMDSKPVACLPKGSVVTVLKDKVSEEYGIGSRRVLVRHVQRDANSTAESRTEGWASIQSSHGYVILSPLASVCYKNTAWGCTRPVIKQCGHAAHLTCVETHMASLHQRSAADQPYDGRFAANIKEGEFLCPLCKHLSNILIPKDMSEPMNDASAIIKEEASTLGQTRLLRNLILCSRMHELSADNFQGLARDALGKFGIHLYNAMSSGSDSGRLQRRKKLKHWHKDIHKWDYEEDINDEESFDDKVRKTKIGSMLRLLRQQLIAWSAVGYGASTAEAATRGYEERLPFGVVSQTSEPWPGFKHETKDSHPMLLELKRTLTAASRHLDVLCLEMKELLPQTTDVTGQLWVIAAAIADIVDGHSWFTTESFRQSVASGASKDLALWSELTAFVSSMPCHVARDGMLLQRCEARATAAAMWAIKGYGTQRPRKGEPMPPLAVHRLQEAGLSPIPRNWGLMNAFIDTPDSKALSAPFRPGIAAAFLYKPLLVWDLHSLAGAIFSLTLANYVSELPTMEELCAAAHTLLVARLIQAIVTPFGVDFDSPREDDEELFWTGEDLKSEGSSLGRLVTYCRCMQHSKRMVPLGEMSENSEIQPIQLVSGLGDAILPFARSLILMLRATSAVIRSRKSKNVSIVSSTSDERILALICGQELMTSEDGFYVLRALGGPSPSSLIDSNGPWKTLIDRWLISAIGFELHHGSMGKTSLSVGETSARTQAQYPPMAAADPSDNSEMHESTSQVEMDIDEDLDQMNESNTEWNTHHVLMDEEVEGSEEELNDVDEAEEMVDFAGQLIEGTLFQPSSNNMSSGDSMLSEDFSSSGSEGDNFDSDREFAHVSRSPILPYQPSTLGIEEIGPGRQGTLFEFASASAVMADLSHLGLIHQRNVPTFSFVRLPRSFVELYNMVNKVKGREDSLNEAGDDMGSSETAICLLTGAVMKSGSSRRQGVYARSSRSPGACTLHARKHGSGIGVFFLVQKCTVLLMHNNKSAYSPSIYVDEHGEEDPGLRRGRPLFLNASRLQALENLWRQHGVPREVAQIRSTSDRVIRDNWY